MDQFFTSLNKRQTMLLLTAVTFGGQEGVAALEHLGDDEGEVLRHRAQELIQIPREKRLPLLVQEIKRLVKDRRGQLWSAEPEKLAALIQRERGALAEVVLRALPAVLAEAVRAHLPQRPVKLTREVRPQVLDIIRWKLEERLSRSAGAQVSFKFTDVLQLPPRELYTVCDRLGARVLGPALAGLQESQREAIVAPLPPDMKQLVAKAVQANAPRKLPEEEAKEQLGVHDGLKNLAHAIRSAGTQRLARACVAQSAEFAARMLERHRGEFGSLLAKWVRDERSKPVSRTTDGGRADIVADLERLAARGLIERPVRLTPQRPALNPPPGRGAPPNREVAPARIPPHPEGRPSAMGGSPRRDVMAEREARRAGAVGAANFSDPGAARKDPRDPMAERAARRAGALSSREPLGGDEAPEGSRKHRQQPRESVVEASLRELLGDEAPEGSRKHRQQPRESAAMSPRESLVRRESLGIADPGGARVSPPPAREPSRVGSRQPPPEVPELSRGGSRQPPPEVPEGSRASSRQPPPEAGNMSRAGSRQPPPEAGNMSRAGSRQPPPEAGNMSRAGSRQPPPEAGSSRKERPPGDRRPPLPLRSMAGRSGERPSLPEDPDGSRVISSPGIRSRGTGVRVGHTDPEPSRPPRVLSGRHTTSASLRPLPSRGEGTSVGRRPRPPPPPPRNSGRGPRGGSR